MIGILRCDSSRTRVLARRAGRGFVGVAVLLGAAGSASGGKAAARPDPAAGTACGEAGCLAFASPALAFEKILERKPEVLGLGEFHEIAGSGRKVSSAIKRFTKLMLPKLKGRASHLIAETWMTSGRCGAVEQKAVAEVQKVTKRPVETENEVLTLLGSASDLGIEPHILKLDCDEYRAILTAEGEMDPEKTLALVGTKMLEKAKELREKDGGAAGGKTLVLYGGALHNDLYPSEVFKDYAFGQALHKLTQGHYLELDLYVPEYIQKDADLMEEKWFAIAMKQARAGKTTLLNPRPDSYVIVFPRTR